MSDNGKGAGHSEPMAPVEQAQTNGSAKRMACGCRPDPKVKPRAIVNDFMVMNGQRIGIQITQCDVCHRNISIGAVQLPAPRIQPAGLIVKP